MNENKLNIVLLAGTLSDVCDMASGSEKKYRFVGHDFNRLKLDITAEVVSIKDFVNMIAKILKKSLES